MMNALKSANASKWMRTALLAALATATAGCNNNGMPEAGKYPEKQNEKMTIHVAAGEKKPEHAWPTTTIKWATHKAMP